jgi:hypothetical protein
MCSLFIGSCYWLLIASDNWTSASGELGDKKPWKQALKLKGKFLPRTGDEGPEGEYRYNSTLSLTSALDGVVG